MSSAANTICCMSRTLSADMNRLRGLFNLFEQKTELLQLLERAAADKASIFLSAANPDWLRWTNAA